MHRPMMFGLVAALGASLESAPLPAQELLDGDGRAPRFLLASARPPREPAPVDVSRIPVLRRRISVELLDVPLEEALRTIASRSGLDLAYSRTAAPLDRIVRLDARDITVAAALTEVLLDTQVDVVFSRQGRAMLVRRGAEEQSGTITGRVIDARTTEGVQDAIVRVEGTALSASSGPDGRYRITNVPPDTYTLHARRVGYGRVEQAVRVVADSETTADFALEPAPTKLEEVVVTGTVVPTEVRALPTPVSVVTAEEFDRQQPRTVQEIFRQVVPTGVAWDLRSYPTLTDFSVRGTTTLTEGLGQMKVFVDGVEATSITNAAVDPKSIERMEVIRGPQAATIYGPEASGGVLQIFTRRGESGATRPTAEAQALLGVMQTPYDGFDGVLRQSYSAAVRGGATDLGYSFGGGYVRTDDYLPGGELSSTSNPSVYGGVNIARGPVRVDIAGRWYVHNNPNVFNPKLSETGFPSFTSPQYTSSQVENQTLGGRLEFEPVPWWRHNLTLGVDRLEGDVQRTRPRLRTPDDTLLFVELTHTGKTSIAYNTSVQGQVRPGLAGVLTAGFDHYRLPFDDVFAPGAGTIDGTIETDPPGQTTATRTLVHNTGVFAQAQLGWRDVLFLTGGVRADDNSAFGDSLGMPVSPRVGLSFVRELGSATVKLRGSWGRAIRAVDPTLKLRSTSFGFVVLANEKLAPERQQGWDAGFDAVLGDRGSLGVTYYNQTASDLIQLVYLDPDGDPQVAQWQNLSRVKNSGIEVEAALLLGPVRVRAQYGYTRSKVEETGEGYLGDLLPGDQVLLVPKHTAGASIGGTVWGGTSVSLGFVYVGSWNYYDFVAEFSCFAETGPCPETNREFIVPYPHFAKVDLRVSRPITPVLGLILSVDNLTNSDVVEKWNLSPVTGRITSIGVSARY